MGLRVGLILLCFVKSDDIREVYGDCYVDVVWYYVIFVYIDMVLLIFCCDVVWVVELVFQKWIIELYVMLLWCINKCCFKCMKCDVWIM